MTGLGGVVWQAAIVSQLLSINADRTLSHLSIKLVAHSLSQPVMVCSQLT